MKKYVYMFPEGNGKMRELLGGKGANLAEMTGLGMPVPPGFTISTEACTRYYEDGRKIAADIEEQIFEARHRGGDQLVLFIGKKQKRQIGRVKLILQAGCAQALSNALGIGNFFHGFSLLSRLLCHAAQ